MDNQEEKTIVKIKFVGIDDWSRPVYKMVGKQVYFGSTNRLFPDKRFAPNGTIEEINQYFIENIEELEYFGRSFNCEPNGGKLNNTQLLIVK